MNACPSPGAALARPRRAQSHHIDQRERKGTPRERGKTQRGPAFGRGARSSGLASPAPRESGRRHRTRERLTRGSEPWKRASSHTALDARSGERTVGKGPAAASPAALGRQKTGQPEVAPQKPGHSRCARAGTAQAQGGRLKRGEPVRAAPSSSAAQRGPPHAHPEAQGPPWFLLSLFSPRPATHARGGRVSTHPRAQNGRLWPKRSRPGQRATDRSPLPPPGRESRPPVPRNRPHRQENQSP